MLIINTRQAANVLGVSATTVRNWVRQGYLCPVTDSKNQFLASNVETLKRSIKSGELTRLRKRANKRRSKNSFLPDEYINDAAFISELENIREIFLSQNLNLEKALLVLTLKMLVLTEEVFECDKSNGVTLDRFTNWKRNCVKDEMLSWVEEINFNENTKNQEYKKLFDALTNVSHNDTIGIIYQSLLMEGRKSRRGAYYTPGEIVDAIIDEHWKGNGKFLDPCCGTGQFLLGAARAKNTSPEQVYGFDIDQLAVKIARINLLLAFKDQEFEPRVYRANSLNEIPDNRAHQPYRLIATNPPWGSAIDGEASRFPHIKTGESFSLFLSMCMELAKPGGLISFLLPESILNIKAHADIREHILNNAKMKSIHYLGRKFKNVFTPVIRLDLVCEMPPENWAIRVVREDKTSHEIPQSRFSRNSNFLFDARLTNNEAAIIAALYDKPHVTLKDNAEWALGIVTGDNDRFISNRKLDGMEPLYKGSDVEPYRLRKPASYIKFEPERFQQAAPETKYRAPEKLIYKFISNKLVFAYDAGGSLTLNSANILIPKVEGYPIKLILALFNSSLYQFIFARKFNTHKILRGDLETLPLPILEDDKIKKIISLVDRAIDGEDVQRKLDKEITEAAGVLNLEVTF